MLKPFDGLIELNALRERLLRGGVAPRHVQRYLGELSDHLTDLRAEEQGAGKGRAEAEAAALLRLGGMDELAQAMIAQRPLQSWSVRAPWAVFGVGPLLLLAGMWCVSLTILWAGWIVFLPGAALPFVRIHGLVILFFGIGRMLYFGAPILTGWEIALVAARQRIAAVWPVVGLVLVALLGVMGQVHVNRTAVPHWGLHVGMGFSLAPFVQRGTNIGLFHVVVISLTVLPYLAYLVWRLQKGREITA